MAVPWSVWDMTPLRFGSHWTPKTFWIGIRKLVETRNSRVPYGSIVSLREGLLLVLWEPGSQTC